MKRILVVLAVVGLVVLVFIASHMKGRFSQRLASPVAKNVPSEAVVAGYFSAPYEPMDIKPSVASYTIKKDLTNIVNLSLFGQFSPIQRNLLSTNGFFVSPTDEVQLFHIYEQNEYSNVPNFITTDSVLQVYHIFYDFTLRNVETNKLHEILVRLTNSMVGESSVVVREMTSPEWKKAAEKNQAYFYVASYLLGSNTSKPSGTVGSLVDKEIKLIEAHLGRDKSPIFGFDIDYSQFVPRGHYTRSPKLEQFFKAMMWYGLVPFPVATDTIPPRPDYERICQALLITSMLYNSRINQTPAIEEWQRVYEPTAFYVGTADDLTPMQLKSVIDKVVGKNASYKTLQTRSLDAIWSELTRLPEPRIKTALIGIPGGKQFRFMGQRYIPDSEIMQRLVKWPERPFPKGLDVMAVLGSKRAADILDNVYHEPTLWSDYLPERSKLLEEFNAKPLSTWQSNMYWGWLWVLDSLLDPPGHGYPAFMQNTAWIDKSLNTSLASWAELRHDTILYAKQSGAECGEDGEELPMPKGYVEPNVEFYNRLLWLTSASKSGLSARGLLTNHLLQKFADFEDLLVFLKRVSEKELTNQKLTKEEYEQIRYYGGRLETLTMSVIDDTASSWYELSSETDKDMAVVADVHTSMDQCLEEAVGHANEIYVVVPIEGKLYLTRGAVFSYYEFVHNASDRLTDEKWQRMLKENESPQPPTWTKSFLTNTKKGFPRSRRQYSTGC